MIGDGSAHTTAPTRQFHLIAVEPEAASRTRWSVELAGFGVRTYERWDDALADLQPGMPVVAVVGRALATDTGFAYLARLTREYPALGVVQVVDTVALDVLQHALRSGVRDVVAHDPDPAPVVAAIQRVAEVVAAVAAQAPVIVQGHEPTTRGTVIVAFSTKGGVGKSLVATNLATGLALRHRSTVLVDADLQFGDVAVLLGIPPRHTTVDVSANIDQLDQASLDSMLAAHPMSGLRVLPAPVEPHAADTITPETMIAIVEQLRTMFEFVVIDMPPHFDDVVLALIEAADHVLLVASMDIPSIKNLKVGIQTLDLLSIAGEKLKLVLNRANAKVNLEIVDVERALGLSADFRVPSDIAVPQSVNRGTPVVIDRPKSQAALALSEIATRFAGTDLVTAIGPGAPASVPPAAPNDASRRRWRRD